jgi:hypothetical protein
LTRAEAETALSDANLAVGNIDKEHKVTVPSGLVIDQSPQAGASVAEWSGIDLVLVKKPEDGIEIPAAWAGEWQITFTYTYAAINHTAHISEEIITDAICPEDPLGLELLEEVLEDKPFINLDENNGTASDSHIQASFSGQFIDVHCNLDFTAQFDIYLNGDNTLTGTGQWSASGVCDISPQDFGQTVIISGIRLSTDPGELCDLPRSSFLQKFLSNSFLFDEEGPL